MKRIHKNTLKKFIRDNNVTMRTTSEFDGMIDCISECDRSQKATLDTLNKIWVHSGNYIEPITNGFEVSNCCGCYQFIKA